MAKLIMLSGLPASGKSTLAKELVMASGNAVRLNRDLLRTMLHFDKWTGRNEGMTIEAEKALARLFLGMGKNVIIDDTNLSQHHMDMWKEIAKETGQHFEHKRMDTSVENCLERDYLRPNSVGEHVITQMAMQYGLMMPPKKGYVLCDLDGTLCDINHRLHYVKNLPEGEKPDWKSFFEHLTFDKLRGEILDKLIELELQGYTIVFVSARPDDHRDATERWLRRNVGKNVNWKTLIMRKAGDHRPDTEVKQDILDKYFEGGKHVHKVFDDRPSVIRMWRENGLEVEDCGSGVEF